MNEITKVTKIHEFTKQTQTITVLKYDSRFLYNIYPFTNGTKKLAYVDYIVPDCIDCENEFGDFMYAMIDKDGNIIEHWVSCLVVNMLCAENMRGSNDVALVNLVDNWFYEFYDIHEPDSYVLSDYLKTIKRILYCLVTRAHNFQ